MSRETDRKETRNARKSNWTCRHCGNTVQLPGQFVNIIYMKPDPTRGFTRIGGRRRCNACLLF